MLFDTFINCNINYIYKFINYSVALAVKKPPANPGDLRDMGSSLGREDPLEKSMATHSRILACRIPWTEEPKGHIACHNSYTSLNPRTLHLRSHLIFTTARKVHHCVSSKTVVRLGFDVYTVLFNISVPCHILFWFVLESPVLAVLSLPQLTALLILFQLPSQPLLHSLSTHPCPRKLVSVDFIPRLPFLLASN